jgi:hypothetical protein
MQLHSDKPMDLFPSQASSGTPDGGRKQEPLPQVSANPDMKQPATAQAAPAGSTSAAF